MSRTSLRVKVNVFSVHSAETTNILFRQLQRVAGEDLILYAAKPATQMHTKEGTGYIFNHIQMCICTQRKSYWLMFKIFVMIHFYFIYLKRDSVH